MRIVLFLVALLSTSACFTQVVNQRQKQTFTPDGYYFPAQPIKVKEYDIEWLSIFTLYANSNTAHLRIQRKGNWTDKSSKVFRISKDSSFFQFDSRKLGRIVIKGRFTGERGPINDRIVALKSIVFEGSIFINGKTTPLTMVWSEGD